MQTQRRFELHPPIVARQKPLLIIASREKDSVPNDYSGGRKNRQGQLSARRML
jgi:hypothetical protein